MKEQIYSSLQIRELFHIEFLRWFALKSRQGAYALKGGVNLRLFFKSIRYSEDMDLDAKGVSVSSLQDAVMSVLENRSFRDSLKEFGIEQIVLPDLTKAKQTETTQRFKVHLLIESGEDLFTKIEFSRRGFGGDIKIESVSENVLRAYKMAPLLAPHYDSSSALIQKIGALTGRSITQARDVFDIYVLIPQCDLKQFRKEQMNSLKFKAAVKNIFEISFVQFRDTVVAYLSPEDKALYLNPAVWDDIKLKAANFIEELENIYGKS